MVKKIEYLEHISDESLYSDVLNFVVHVTHSTNELLPRSKKEIREALNNDNILLAVDSKSFEIVGFIISFYLLDDWQELTTLYVNEKYRGLGIGKELCRKIHTRLSRSNLILFTENIKVISIFQDIGFEVTKLSSLPIKLKIALLLNGILYCHRVADLLANLKNEKNQKVLIFKNA